MRPYQRRRRLRRRRKQAQIVILGSFIIVFGILLTLIIKTRSGAPGESTEASEVVIAPALEEQTEVWATIEEPETEETATESLNHYPEFTYGKDWTDEEAYLLAKIAMAEAEGESIQAKTLVIMAVLNRTQDESFPDSIQDVIYQEGQFTPVSNGRFESIEPNEDCWEAVEVVAAAEYDYSGGALYFESCENADNWHSRNLEFLYQCGNIKFYK